jgi:hypothetical protein
VKPLIVAFARRKRASSCSPFRGAKGDCLCLHPATSTGVTRGLWDYLNDPAFARGYDAQPLTSPRYTKSLSVATPPPGRFIDLGCGTGVLRLLWPARPSRGRGGFVRGNVTRRRAESCRGERASTASRPMSSS